jgi:hypothetical protein
MANENQPDTGIAPAPAPVQTPAETGITAAPPEKAITLPSGPGASATDAALSVPMTAPAEEPEAPCPTIARGLRPGSNASSIHVTTCSRRLPATTRRPGWPWANATRRTRTGSAFSPPMASIMWGWRIS